MEICRSLGTATIVALMAAHREVSRPGDDAVSRLDQATVARMLRYLDAACTTDARPAPRSSRRTAPRPAGETPPARA